MVKLITMVGALLLALTITVNAQERTLEGVVTDKDGNPLIVAITDLTDNTITLDANHPLAGKDLTFEISLVEIVK